MLQIHIITCHSAIQFYVLCFRAKCTVMGTGYHSDSMATAGGSGCGRWNLLLLRNEERSVLW